jgi:hypothetical protein
MATRPAVRPCPAAPASPLTIEAFGEMCLDAVLARTRGDALRRQNGTSISQLYTSAGDKRTPREGRQGARVAG